MLQRRDLNARSEDQPTMMRAVKLSVDPTAFDLSFREPPLSERSGRPIIVGIGDDVVGPLVGMFFDAPSTPEQLAGPPDLTPPHGHPCDNFRIVMKGELWVGQERYHHGEFRLQRSGTPYGADGDAPHIEGNWRIIVFADRRGHMVRPTNPKLREEMLGPTARQAISAHYGDMLPTMLEDDDDGVDGLRTTIDKPFSKLGHIDSSFDEAESWREFFNHSRVAVTVMSDHQIGPVALLQRTPAGVVATPELTIGSDVFRCVIRGSKIVRETTSVMGDARFQAAGVTWPETVAGDEGLDEVFIIGNRSGLELNDSAWGDELLAIVRELVADLSIPQPRRRARNAVRQ
jgi:hypothetical protein